MIFYNHKNGRVATIRKVNNLFGDLTVEIMLGNQRTMKRPEITYYEDDALANIVIHNFTKLRLKRGYELIEDQLSLMLQLNTVHNRHVSNTTCV